MVAKIRAFLINNHTGIHLEAGVTYDCVATGRWRDWSHECDADGYEAAKLDRWKSKRRVKDQPWFKLIGVVDGEQHVLGTRATITPSRSGELICFANDVWYMFWNNRGSVELKVTARK